MKVFKWGDFKQTCNLLQENIQFSACWSPLNYHQSPSVWPPPRIEAWQFMGDLESTQTATPEDVGPGLVEKGTKFRNVTLIYDNQLQQNHNVTEDHVVIVPYNSSLWYNGTSINIEAPFLNLRKNCFWDSPLGYCLCYNGQPLPSDIQSNSTNPMVCLNGNLYNWGFSSFLTVIGLSLESLWALACFCLWVFAKRSKLVSHGRSSVGTVRNVLDLAEIVNAQLGQGTSVYPDQKLREELEKCPPVGYAVIPGKGDMLDQTHIGLVSVPERPRARRRSIHVDFETLYA